MKEKIDQLLQVLNKHSIKELNRIYRDKEVQLEIEGFTKYPDVKYGEGMKKRLIQAAKRKKISKGRCDYIEQQIDALNKYNRVDHFKTAVEDVKVMLDCVGQAKIAKADIVLLHIEFSDARQLASIEAYGKFKDKWYENELGRFESNFDSAKYWEELDSSKFNSMAELLEIIYIDDEEYPQLYHQIRELRVFNAIKHAFQHPEITGVLESEYPKVRIEIGMHDDEFHTIYSK